MAADTNRKCRYTFENEANSHETAAPPRVDVICTLSCKIFRQSDSILINILCMKFTGVVFVVCGGLYMPRNLEAGAATHFGIVDVVCISMRPDSGNQNQRADQ